MPWTWQWPTTLTAHPEPFSRSRGQHIRLVNPSPERSSSWWWCCSSVTGTAHARLVHSVPWFTKPMLWYYWANSELLCSFVLWDVVGAKAHKPELHLHCLAVTEEVITFIACLWQLRIGFTMPVPCVFSVPQGMRILLSWRKQISYAALGSAGVQLWLLSYVIQLLLK